MEGSTAILLISSTKIEFFFLPGPTTGHSHAIGIQNYPITPSSALLVPHVSSPCSDANGGIDPLALGSPD